MCPVCQRPAAVGVQCVDCVRSAARAMPTARTVFGGRGTDGRPLVTLTIIGICVLVWVGELTSPTVYDNVAFASFLGKSEPWRFMTSAFAHIKNPIHIGMNMYALWLLGPYLESLLGRVRFAVTYLVTALGGSVVFLLMTSPPAVVNQSTAAGSSWFTGLVGASGAVFGLFGVLLVLHRHLGRSTGGIYATLLINAVLGFTIPGIAWQAHVGGFITGLACGGIVAYAGRGPARRPWLQWGGLAVVTLVLVALAVAKYASVGPAAVA